ncbi:hypothetical protein RFI_04028 [Reticulomyxa filosa]|uniref:Uncharacterized protein n=1 Tax=Reticulomyxa filosa TaxID=46433 RepID=X6P636_RETFI|nr:hypothetical protein RFI_04028 [Reticulomyxa filosa]|eukprot:ETO33077.1 hypothetical protein RFI_04028 [Reticulomyxa filosa]
MFALEADACAKEIRDGLERNVGYIDFPWNVMFVSWYIGGLHPILRAIVAYTCCKMPIRWIRRKFPPNPSQIKLRSYANSLLRVRQQPELINTMIDTGTKKYVLFISVNEYLSLLRGVSAFGTLDWQYPKETSIIKSEGQSESLNVHIVPSSIVQDRAFGNNSDKQQVTLNANESNEKHSFGNDQRSPSTNRENSALTGDALEKINTSRVSRLVRQGQVSELNGIPESRENSVSEVKINNQTQIEKGLQTDTLQIKSFGTKLVPSLNLDQNDSKSSDNDNENNHENPNHKEYSSSQTIRQHEIDPRQSTTFHEVPTLYVADINPSEEHGLTVDEERSKTKDDKNV